jgi:hypothetical protein
MANAFSKEEIVAFEDMLEGFNDSEVMSKNVNKYSTNDTTMERTNNVIWRPQPYIAQTFDGTDQTANFKSSTQLSVPATLGYQKSSPILMTALELRDALQQGNLGKAARQKLASDVNKAVLSVACNQGTLVVKRTSAASGYDDVAVADSVMNEQGIPQYDRVMALTSRDYNGMASNLAARQTMNEKPTAAYEKNRVGVVAGFDTYKLDYGNRLTAAAGGGAITVSTLVGAGNYYVPKATSVAAGTGETSNVDNRYQTITVTSTTNVAAGDAFTIGGAEAVHHIAKTGTGQLKSFRVISVPSATTLVISPPIISNQGGSSAEAQYQNVIVTPSATAPIVWLNTVTASVNPFWQKDSIELLPARYAVPSDAGAAIMRATTDSGIEVVMQKQYDIKTMETFFRWDIFFGVVNLQPEMSGIMLFSQT